MLEVWCAERATTFVVERIWTRRTAMADTLKVSFTRWTCSSYQQLCYAKRLTNNQCNYTYRSLEQPSIRYGAYQANTLSPLLVGPIGVIITCTTGLIIAYTKGNTCIKQQLIEQIL